MRSEKRTPAIFLGVLLFLWSLIPGSGMPASLKDHPSFPRSGDVFPCLSFPNALAVEEKRYLGIGEKETFSLANIEANVLVINFLDTNCVYCIKSLSAFKEVFQKVEQDQDLRNRIKILGIGAGDTPAEIAALNEKYKIPYPIIPATEFEANRTVNEPTVPFVVVTRRDQQGEWVVATVHVGLTFSAESLAGELKAILNTDPNMLKKN